MIALELANYSLAADKVDGGISSLTCILHSLSFEFGDFRSFLKRISNFRAICKKLADRNVVRKESGYSKRNREYEGKWNAGF